MASNKCAACKVLRMDCVRNHCVFAPHFPANNPRKFDNVNRVFGAESVYKFLSNLECHERGKAAQALCYEAEARLSDPTFGVIGLIEDKERQLEIVKNKIESAKRELEAMIKPEDVPPYVDVPIPDDFLAPPPSAPSINRDEDRSDSHGDASSSSAGSSASVSSHATRNIAP